jgi:uncharacterized protein YdeI (BOF family)/plastocyanin
MRRHFFSKFVRVLLSLFIASGGFFVNFDYSKALDQDIKINEVVYAPSDSVEWVELYNSGLTDVDLNNWILTDEDGAFEYTFTSSVIFPPDCFLIIRSDSGTNDLDFSDGAGIIYADHGSDYANTQDQVAIYRSSTVVDETTIIDFVAWGGDAGSDDDYAVLAGIWSESEFVSNVSTGHSMGLILDGADNDDVTDWQEFNVPTPGESNENINQPPSIDDAWADPDSVPADDSTFTLLTAAVSDPDGLADIVSVEIDLSDIGGSDVQEMYDDETHGDELAGDSVFSYLTTVSTSTSPGNYQLSVIATDLVDDTDVQDLDLQVTIPVYSNSLRINEVLPNPSGSETTDEYVELHNAGSSAADLEGWIIKDSSSSSYAISSADFTSTTISAGGYFVIYRDKSGIALNNSGDSVELYQPDNNLLDSVTYSESASVDTSYNYASGSWRWSTTLTPGAANQITSPNNPPEADAGDDQSVSVGESVSFDGTDSLDPDGDSLSCSWDFDDGESGTGCSTTHTFEKAGIFTVTLTVNDGRGEQDTDTVRITVSEGQSGQSGSFSSDVIINEFLPNPEGSDNQGEFIEIFNEGSETVDLFGWQLDDEEGGSSPYTIPDGTSIVAGEYLVFYREATGISINNSGDAVRLLYPNGNVADEVRYEGSAREGEAYAQDSAGSWKWTNTPTPGKANVIDEPGGEEENASSSASSSSSGSSSTSSSTLEGVKELTIKQAKAQSKNTQVKVRGIVTVPPDVLNSTYFYIQDSTAGVQIYFSKKDFPGLKLGDYVEVVGKVSERSREKKINVQDKEDMKVISHKNLPEPAFVKTGDVKEPFEGQLIRVTGQITRSSGNTFYIDDGSGEIKVYIQKSTGIKKPDWKKGDWVTITGIVGETSSGYRVMPRYQEDLKSGKHVGGLGGNLPAAGLDIKWSLLIIILLAVGIVTKNKRLPV